MKKQKELILTNRRDIQYIKEDLDGGLYYAHGIKRRLLELEYKIEMLEEYFNLESVTHPKKREYREVAKDES